jgi:importin-7
LAAVIEQTFGTLVTLATNLLNSPPAGAEQEIPVILHLILKSYKHSIVLNLSKHQQSAESLVPWGRLLFQVLDLRIPADAVPVDEEERERSEWWKAKKWACGILGRLFHRYGSIIVLMSRVSNGGPVTKVYPGTAIRLSCPALCKTNTAHLQITL